MLIFFFLKKISLLYQGGLQGLAGVVAGLRMDDDELSPAGVYYLKV